MAYRYKYIDFKTEKVLFQTVQPNYKSDEDVDKMCFENTGRDPRLERATITREIRLVEE